MKILKMKSENEYIGDDKFKKFLQHYSCPTPLEVVKLRFAGAICSPNTQLRPTDVISSLWENNLSPRLETKAEADLFFKFFMGLWDMIFAKVAENKLELDKLSSDIDLVEMCHSRYNQIEQGFVEGFWGGCENLKIPGYIAEIIDSLSQMANLYQSLAQKAETQKNSKNIFDAIADCDKMTQKSIHFIIEHYALPHINELKRTVN